MFPLQAVRASRHSFQGKPVLSRNSSARISIEAFAKIRQSVVICSSVPIPRSWNQDPMTTRCDERIDILVSIIHKHMLLACTEVLSRTHQKLAMISFGQILTNPIHLTINTP